MSDNEDLLGDDLGDHSLADYNLGNEEEEQLLADDYDSGTSQNVPSSISSYGEGVDIVVTEYSAPIMQYGNQPVQYQMPMEPECVVPNITVEVPNTPLPEHSTYAPYEPPPPVYETEHCVVPPAIPASPMESPQIVPSEMAMPLPNGDMGGPRERFISERPVGAQRLPQVRDIPDSLDKVVVPRGQFGGRGRTSWRSPQFAARYHQYRRHHTHRGNFSQRPSFPPPHLRPNIPQMRPELRPEFRPEMRQDLRPRPEIRVEIRPDIRPGLRPDLGPELRPSMPPEMRPELRPEMRPEMRPPDMRPEIRPGMPADLRPEMRPEMHQDLRPEIHPEMRPDLRPEIRPEMRQDLRPEIRPEMRPDLRPEMRPDLRSEMRQDLRPEMRPDLRPDLDLPMRPEISPERIPNMPIDFQPMGDLRPFQNRPFFRPELHEPRPNFPMRPFERPPFYPQRPMFNPRPFGPQMREVVQNSNHLPQVTVRPAGPPGPRLPKEPEVRMLPVQLPANLPPGGLAGKKVLINPHFKGTFQPPVEGPIKDIDDAAERFIAEQRNALARAASRKFPPARRSPQRYIENTTIEIENDLARVSTRRRSDDEDLLRRQEEFINANRAGLRRRMRSPTPPRRSLSPRRSPERTRPRLEATRPPPSDEESEYRRRMREQESLRERVLRAKEVRRRKNAAAAAQQKHALERERERLDKEKEPPKPVEPKTEPETTSIEDTRPDTTRKSPEKIEKVEKLEKVEKIERERSPVRKEEAEVNSTCENLTPPREEIPKPSPERNLTPPLPARGKDDKSKEDKRFIDSDDDLDLILGDIDGILSDEDDSGRFKEKSKKPESPKPKPAVDLRTKLPPKPAPLDTRRPPRQKIVFHDKEKEERKRKEKSPPKKTFVSSSTKTEDSETIEKKASKSKEKPEISTTKSRPRIIFDKKEQQEKEDLPKTQFSNRRVILQRKVSQQKESVFTRVEVKTDPSKPNPGIFSRAVRTAIGGDKNRIVIKKEEPQIEYESESDIDEDKLLEEDIGYIASVENLPHGMTDTRLKTLAGNDVQSLVLDKEERSAKITFKTIIAAENFKKKFNNKMVAASRLTVTLR